MKRDPAQLVSNLHNAIWSGQPEQMPAWKVRCLRLVRLLLVLIRDVTFGQLTLRAMSLVYTTLLSLVPMLALSFSVLKAFGVHNQIEPTLMSFLAPLGAEGQEVSRRIIGFIENMNVGVLGSVGLGLLIYTAISLVQKIEEAFNFIWHITRARSIGQRFSNYLSVLLVGPLLVFSAIGLTAAVTSIGLVRTILAIEPFGRIAYEVGRVVPYVLVIGAFTFIYVFIPNTRVRLGPALAGAIVGGILWQSAGWAFAQFVASSTQYAAIYSSFAIMVLFMIWLYLSWLILLLGASVAFYRQHPEYLVARGGEPRLSNRMRERLALLIVSRIAEHHLAGHAAWTLQQLTQALGVPMHAVETVLGALRQGGILAETGDDPPAYLPARDLDTVSVKRLMDVVRAADEERYLSPDTLPVPAPVEEMLQRLDQAMDATTGDRSLRNLVAASATSGTRQSRKEGDGCAPSAPVSGS